MRSGGSPTAAACSWHRLLQPGRRLPGRCGERDARRRSRAGRSSRLSSRATVCVLPVPGPPVSTLTHRPAATAAASRCRSGAGPGNSVGQPRQVDRGRRPQRPLVELAADPLLLLPVPVEVEQPVDQPQRSPRLRRARPRRAGCPASADQSAGHGSSTAAPTVLVRRRRPRVGDASASSHADRPRRAPPRTASAAASSTPGAARRPSRDSRSATCTSAAASTPAVGEHAQQPARPQRRSRHGPASRSDSSTTSPGGGCQANTPAPGGPVRPAHAADEQVQHRPEVPVRVVAGLPPAQEPVQRDGVQQRLQRRSARAASPRPAPRAGSATAVSGSRAEPVGLVVDDDVRRAAGRRSTRVDAAGEEAAQRLRLERVRAGRGSPRATPRSCRRSSAATSASVAVRHRVRRPRPAAARSPARRAGRRAPTSASGDPERAERGVQDRPQRRRPARPASMPRAGAPRDRLRRTARRGRPGRGPRAPRARACRTPSRRAARPAARAATPAGGSTVRAAGSRSASRLVVLARGRLAARCPTPAGGRLVRRRASARCRTCAARRRRARG